MARTSPQSPFYRALVTKDRRFDGRVFFGVTTTGIYCRPICPARTPHKKNVAFFQTAAAAEEAGFRPCFRCRPETSPGTPAWLGTTATVSRALRLISLGALDREGLPALADQFGVTERHLSRLFVEHLGAPPHAVALLRRLDFARQLVDETSLPMTEIAFNAGFESVRRFNDAFKKRFHRSPTEARQKRGPKEKTDTALVLRLPYRPPLAWDDMFAFLSSHAIAGIETFEEGVYSRTFEANGVPGFLSVRPKPEASLLELSLHGAVGTSLLDIVEKVRFLFDLEADPLTISTHLSQDLPLKKLIELTPGLRVPGGWDGYEVAIRAIMGQQVSIRGACTSLGRIVVRYGKPLRFETASKLLHLFPTPLRLAKADPATFGVPRTKAAALVALSQAVVEGKVRLSPASDGSEQRAALLAIRGIGPWTAEYIAMRALRDPDAFPETDLILGRELKKQKAGTRAQGWQPWRAYATHYLWKAAMTAVPMKKGKTK